VVPFQFLAGTSARRRATFNIAPWWRAKRIFAFEAKSAVVVAFFS
jgi:hypothetical protein